MSRVRLEEIHHAAERALVAGKYSESAELSSYILQHFPKELDAHVRLAQAKLALDDTTAAKGLFEFALRLDPENAPSWAGKARIAEMEADFDAAVELYRRVLDVEPSARQPKERIIEIREETGTDTGVRLKVSQPGLARLYLEQGLYSHAVGEFSTAMRANGDRLDVKLGFAEANWIVGQPGEAADICEAVLLSAPECLKANLITAIVASDKGKTEEAEQRLARARDVDPDDRLLRQLLACRPAPGEETIIPTYATLPAPEGLAWWPEPAVPGEEAGLAAAAEREAEREEEALAGEEAPFARETISLEEEVEAEEEKMTIDVSWLDRVEPLPQEMEEDILSEMAGEAGPPEPERQYGVERPLEDLLADAEAVSKQLEEELAILEEKAAEVQAAGHPGESEEVVEEAEEAAVEQPETLAGQEEAPVVPEAPAPAELEAEAVPEIPEAAGEELIVVERAEEITVEVEMETSRETPSEVARLETEALAAEPEVAEAVPVEPEAVAAETPAGEVEREAPAEPVVSGEVPAGAAAEAVPPVAGLEQARALAAAGRFDEAARGYRVLLKRGEVPAPEVLADLQGLVASAPDTLLTHKALGEAYLATNHFEEAIAELTWYPPKRRKKRY